MRRSARNRHRVIGAFVAAALLVLAPSASADSLADAKAAGYVGERTDGMLGLVTSDVPRAVRELVKSVNAKRRERYGSIARENDTSVEAVAALAGKKAIEKTEPGNYVQNASGRWVKK